ncbi:hypothetical protein FK545_11620 [Planococcus glaciei]|nr:hypothetical protein [Planococcus glaciei]QDY45841.1 hypothetical protein FK545_11620 [Planococcus glaciei]
MTTLGTYLLFSSLLPVIIRKWKSRTRTNLKGINAFTLSQLSFRLNDLKWVLATIAMLIALSAGAIAGGFAFKNNAVTSIDQERLYDATLYNPSTAEEEILKSLSLTEQLSYRFKMDDQFIYYAEEELVENPPLIVDWIDYKQKRPGPLPEKMETDETGYPILPDDWMTALETINPAFATTRLARMVPLESFEKTGGEEIAIVLARTDKFQNYIPEWQHSTACSFQHLHSCRPALIQ